MPGPSPSARSRRARSVQPLRLLAVLLLLGAENPAPAAAQACLHARGAEFCDRESGDQLTGEALTFGVNALLGALTSGIAQHLQGGSFWKGARTGAAGGAAVFAGKRLAVEDFPAAGLVGRGMAAAGSSVIYNAAAGRPALSEVVLPVGITRFYIRPRDDTPLRVQLDVVASVALLHAIADSDLRFEFETSLSSGTAVFREAAPSGRSRWSGREAGGVVQLSGDIWATGRPYWRRVLAHELVHVIQYDQGFMLVGRPMEAAVVPRLPGGPTLERWFDFGLETPLWALLNHVVEYDRRPWETEAELLGRTSRAERPMEHGIPSLPIGHLPGTVDRRQDDGEPIPRINPTRPRIYSH